TQSSRTLSSGTLQYMSPEQVLGSAPGTASDIFSLGMVLYELVAGEHPFAAESPILVANRIVEDEPPAPSRHNASVPPALDALLLEMLARDPARRPEARSVADRILAAAQAPPGSGRLRRPKRGVLIAVAALAVAAAGGTVFLRRPRPAVAPGQPLAFVP